MRNIALLLVLSVFCSCGFFERKGFDENEIKRMIFPREHVLDGAVNTYSVGGVGGRAFVAKITSHQADEVLQGIVGFEQTSFYTAEDRNRELLIEIFNSRIRDIFGEEGIPQWIDGAKCKGAVIESKKVGTGFVIYGYSGVAGCDDVYFVGYQD